MLQLDLPGSDLEPMPTAIEENLTSRKLESVSELKMPENVNRSKFLTLQTTLRSHFDAVRGLHFLSNDSILASGSEDGMLKLWSLDTRNPSYFLDPLRTIRAHKSPIFSITGGVGPNERLIYTAGEDGDIAVWYIPELTTLKTSNSYLEDIFVGRWSGHTDCIWSLSHHTSEPLLLSASADTHVNLWRSGPAIANYSLNTYTHNIVSNPTTVSWVRTEVQSFVVGYTTGEVAMFST
jgi:WD40 repeat protein